MAKAMRHLKKSTEEEMFAKGYMIALTDIMNWMMTHVDDFRYEALHDHIAAQFESLPQRPEFSPLFSQELRSLNESNGLGKPFP